VYNIFCKNCDITYVEQTKRKLNTKISKHRNQLNKKSTNTTVITEYRLCHNHDFAWLNVKILDSERFCFKKIYFCTIRTSYGHMLKITINQRNVFQ